nr:hypothetical protein [Tanacetum cinerariifolium]
YGYDDDELRRSWNRDLVWSVVGKES